MLWIWFAVAKRIPEISNDVCCVPRDQSLSWAMCHDEKVLESIANHVSHVWLRASAYIVWWHVLMTHHRQHRRRHHGHGHHGECKERARSHGLLAETPGSHKNKALSTAVVDELIGGVFLLKSRDTQSCTYVVEWLVMSLELCLLAYLNLCRTR